MLTVFGVTAAIVMVIAYAFEVRSAVWIAVFAAGCAATALYAVLTQSWVFAGLEGVWSVIAVTRYVERRAVT